MSHAAADVKTVTIVGTGLLGTSLGLALKARSVVQEVIGVSRSAEGLRAAGDRGALDRTAPDLATVAGASDCVVLCTPVGTMADVMQAAAAALRPDVLVTDVGSTKAQVVRDVCAAWPNGAARFIGAHPMAGAEQKGAARARADLFEGATVVLTPQPSADADAVARIRALWEAVGGRVVILSPEEHDTVVARTSHLPHLVATVLTELVASLDADRRAVIGQGFLDTTRVAAGDPEMWRDVCLTNADAITGLWPELLGALDHLRTLLEAGDGPGLLDYFTRLRETRVRLEPDDDKIVE